MHDVSRVSHTVTQTMHACTQEAMSIRAHISTTVSKKVKVKVSPETCQMCVVVSIIKESSLIL